jgi:hypothetical protein
MAGAQAPDESTVRLVDNGFCAGLSWVTLAPGESVTRDVGPDFEVYRGRGPGERSWGIYSGFAGQSHPDRDHVLVRREGVAVYRGTSRDGAFNGYIAGDHRAQNHFFGNVFTDRPADAAFFARVEFGDEAKARCGQAWHDD